MKERRKNDETNHSPVVGADPDRRPAPDRRAGGRGDEDGRRAERRGFCQKLVTKNEKDYLCLEALVNGDIKTVKSVTPCDIVLVLDQSGSMNKTVKQTTYTYKEVDCKEWSYNKVRNYLKNGTKLYYQPCLQCGEAHEVQYWKNYHLFDDDTYQIGYQCGWDWYALRDNGKDDENASRDYVFYTGTLYTRTATTTTTNKFAALKAAANAFLTTVLENAKQYNVDHRVAIVGFGSAESDYTNTEILTLKNGNTVGKNYNQLKKTDYKNALVACNTNGAINSTLTDAVNALDADGATAVDLGLEMANNIFKNQPDGTYTGEKARAKIVVVTDGNPTHSSGFETKVANNAIKNAKNLKDAKAMIFTVGIALSDIDATKFISYVSSDYPNAAGWNSPGAPIAAAPKYTNYVSDAEAMKEIFSDIASEATSVSASAKLTQTAVLTDTISQYFKLPEGATKDSIEVYTSAAKFEDGAFTWDTEKKLTNANIKIDGQKIEVTGFDYTANCVTKTAKNKEGTDFGKKLVIYIPIEKDATKAQFGGYLPTNTDATLDDTHGDTGFKAQSAHKDCTVVAPKLAGKTITIKVGEKATITELFENITPDGTEWPDGSNNAGVKLVYTIKDKQSNTIATATVSAGSSEVTWKFESGKTDENLYDKTGEFAFTLDCTVTCKNETAHEGSTANSKQATGIIKVEPTTATVTLTKEITGSLTDAEKQSVLTNLKVYAKLDENNKTELVKGSDGKYSATLQAGNYTIEETNYTVDGYTCTSKLNNSDTFTFTVVAGQDQELTLTNTYEKIPYTVTYTDGVNKTVFADDVHNNVAYGDAIPDFKDGTPTRADYNFNGWKWYKETDRNMEINKPETMPAYNLVAVAQWTEKGSVTINYVAKTGGTVTRASETLNPDTGTAAGSTATPNADYAFAGWYSDPECTEAKKVGSNVDFTPTKPEGGWVTTTYYAKFEQIQVNVNLSPYVKKTLEVDGTLPTGFSETFKVDVTVDGQRLQQQGTVTMTAAGTSNFNMPTVALTEGTHTIMVQEVVDEQTKNSNIAYDTNQKTFVLNILTSGAAAPVQYGTTNSDGNFDEVKEPAFVTITNTYTEPKNAQVTNKEVVVTQPEDALKTAVYAFEIVSKVTVLYPTGNGTTSNTLEVPYGTDSVTLLYAITVNRGTESDKMDFADDGAEFVFAVGAEVTKDMTTGKFDVTFNTGVSTAVIYVAKTHTPLNFVGGKCTVENVISEEIKATTTVTEKDPDKCTIDFSTLIFKVLTKTGDRSFNGAEFTASVDGWKVNQYDVMSMRVIKTHFVDLQPVTLKATFPANTTFDADGKAYRGFTGDTLTVTAGRYLFLIDEINDGQTNITYDESKYWLNLGFMENAEGKVSLAGQRVRKFVDGDTYETVLALEDSEWMVVDTSISPVYFENTIDTGKDDYYPIIIPTIINKDTGMLNKTDHFAYVIGYPDGTVHPNGQITRAEVATIFFRLLRDEVRDGAFTTSNSYSDVAYGKWYNNPISTMSALGIITGYPDGTFKPNKPITRAEFAAIAARFDETQSGKSATFSDVIGHWAAKEIGIAYYNDWIKGYPDGTFKPDQNITRAEAMTMINRVLERKPESPADLLTNMNKWTDNMDTSKWYYLDVQEATNSHAYTRKTFNYELWRQMLPDPDWSRYER